MRCPGVKLLHLDSFKNRAFADSRVLSAFLETKMDNGTKVHYRYNLHYFCGGHLITGTGIIIGSTVVGTDDSYIIKPDDGSDCVHVRAHGVSRA